MDIFHEQIVKKPNSGLRIAAKAGIMAGFLLLAAAALVLLFGFFPMNTLLVALFVYLGWYLSTGLSVEYEYILTNNDLDIDKIIAKRKRKRLISIKMPTLTEFTPLTDANRDAGERTLISCAGNDFPSVIADFKHDKLGDCRLVFSPSEEMLAEITKVLPRTIRAKTAHTS
jgi:uncharacterized membrane protein